MDQIDDVGYIGRRLREIRSWRGLSLRAAAELSGLSHGYLGQIERGEKPVNNRTVLESLAMTLRVSPAELIGRPWAPADATDNEAQSALVGLEIALEAYELGHDPGCKVRPWPELKAEVVRLTDLMHVHADYAGQGLLAPQLLPELHATYVRDPEHRNDALLGLIHCYSSACFATKRLGSAGFSAIAARMAQQCADELDIPEWRGYTAWLRGDATGQLSRQQQYARSVRVSDELSPFLDDPNVVQAYGMLHLSAALAAAAQQDKETATTHLREAESVAGRLDDEVGSFARLWFGQTNIGIWKVTLATEFGDTGQVSELASTVHPEQIPSPSRQAEFWGDVGRVLMSERSTRERGMTALLTAEKLAPQRIRNDVFIREAVADQIRAARREAGGRELRGLAWRLGVAPTG